VTAVVYSEPIAPSGSKTALSVTLTSLANVTYVAATTIDVSAIDPIDVIVEVEITPGTVAGNKRLLVFCQESLDNSALSTGPVSGTTVTDEPNLLPIGTLPLNTNSTLQRKAFSVRTALGWVPPYIKFVFFNDSGAAFSGSACAANYVTQTGLGT
jgi:hypothetical protein